MSKASLEEIMSNGFSVELVMAQGDNKVITLTVPFCSMNKTLHLPQEPFAWYTY